MGDLINSVTPVHVNLAPNFAGTGYNDQTALWTDHGLRLYTFTRL